MASLLNTLVLCLVFMGVVAMAEGCKTCPDFTVTDLSGDYSNYSYTTRFTVAKRLGGPTSDDQNNCRNTTWDDISSWASSCQWRLNCATHNGSMIFRQLYVNVKKGSSIQVSNFSIWNDQVLSSPLIGITSLYVPRDSVSTKEYTYAPNTLLTGNSDHSARVSLTLSSIRPAVIEDYEVEVFLNFTCSRVHRYVYVEHAHSLTSDSGFLSIIAAYVIPALITVVVVIIAVFRHSNPDRVNRLKKRIGFKELDDEALTRHAKIKDRSGGGTWHDNAREVVSDLKSNHNIHEAQARNEMYDSDEELGNFSPVKPSAMKPVRPMKEVEDERRKRTAKDVDDFSESDFSSKRNVDDDIDDAL